MLLPESGVSIRDISMLRGKMSSSREIGMGRYWPDRTILFALQAPLMCFTYSILLFLGGLTSVVLSPLIHDPEWNDEAKVVVARSVQRVSSFC